MLKRNRFLPVALALVILVSSGSWLAWYETLPLPGEEPWASVAPHPREFALYLFNATPANGVRVLRDGLVRELARSGALPQGYPEVNAAPWPPFGCQDRHLVNMDGRFFIHLSEVENNYIEIPLCPPTAMDSFLSIHILPAWPWAKAGPDAPQVFIGMVRLGVFDELHLLKTGQRELILEALKNMGVKLYVDEHMRDVLEYRETSTTGTDF
jgi:hypothetical protein